MEMTKVLNFQDDRAQRYLQVPPQDQQHNKPEEVEKPQRLKNLESSCNSLMEYVMNNRDNYLLEKGVDLKAILGDPSQSDDEEESDKEEELMDPKQCYAKLYIALERLQKLNTTASQFLPALFFFYRALHQQFILSDKNIVHVSPMSKFKIPLQTLNSQKALEKGTIKFLNQYFEMYIEERKKKRHLVEGNAAIGQSPKKYFDQAITVIEEVLSHMYCRVVQFIMST